MGMIDEFKEFALKGNVVDLAVGVVIGAAFGAVVLALFAALILIVLPTGLAAGARWSLVLAFAALALIVPILMVAWRKLRSGRV